jgi:acetylornithine deacetylase
VSTLGEQRAAVSGAVVSRQEEQVIARVREGCDELLDLVGQLVAFDTTSREPGDPARDEVRLQELLASRLRAVGAEVDLWEPEPTGTGNRFVPDGLDFQGRPQLLAHLSGRSHARSLLLNGHIDAVTPGEISRWTSHPFRTEVRDGQLYGRGVADMKGGIAAMLFALECLNREGIQLGEDIVFCTNTDEESSGAGGYAVVGHGLSADAGICAEPTGFNVWTACRGTWMATMTLLGRTGHAEMTHPHWSQGGAVNAIEKLPIVLQSISAMREDWRRRPDHQHPLLNPGDIVPTVVRGGEWIVTYPESCSLTVDVTYLPSHVDAAGSGGRVAREVMGRINAAAQTDLWLAEHPLLWQFICDTVPAEVPSDLPLVGLLLEAATAVGRTGAIGGLDSWHDAATYTRFGIPTVSFGPLGVETAHTVNEHMPVDSLVDYCCAVALAAMRFHGC